jgi:hypothetical protein
MMNSNSENNTFYQKTPTVGDPLHQARKREGKKRRRDPSLHREGNGNSERPRGREEGWKKSGDASLFLACTPFYQMPKYGFERCVVFSEPIFLKFNRSISGITGHQVKKKWVIYLLAVECKDPLMNILFRSQIATENYLGYPKNVT